MRVNNAWLKFESNLSGGYGRMRIHPHSRCNSDPLQYSDRTRLDSTPHAGFHGCILADPINLWSVRLLCPDDSARRDSTVAPLEAYVNFRERSLLEVRNTTRSVPDRIVRH
jgi:hypothetical protein